MKVSVYTYVKNGLRQDYHVVDMVRHHLPLADELVVHDGMSTDGTYEALRDLDPKVKLFRTDWDAHTGMGFIHHFKGEARRRCTGDWCVMLDADEFVPEWEFDRLRATMAATDKVTLSMVMRNFYGNYKVVNTDPGRFRWPAMKRNVHRNVPGIELWGGDASSVKADGEEFSLDPAGAVCEMHHFGYVRKPARLRETWRNMRGRMYNAPPPRVRLPGWVFDLLPHKWADPEFLPYLAAYDGPYIKAVRDNPAEFVRDGWALHKALAKAAPAGG